MPSVRALYGIRDHARAGKTTSPRRRARLQANRLILRALFTPRRRATLTTADDSALPKAISRQDRGNRHRTYSVFPARACPGLDPGWVPVAVPSRPSKSAFQVGLGRLVSFDSEARKQACRRMMRASESGHWSGSDPKPTETALGPARKRNFRSTWMELDEINGNVSFDSSKRPLVVVH